MKTCIRKRTQLIIYKLDILLYQKPKKITIYDYFIILYFFVKFKLSNLISLKQTLAFLHQLNRIERFIDDIRIDLSGILLMEKGKASRFAQRFPSNLLFSNASSRSRYKTFHCVYFPRRVQTPKNILELRWNHHGHYSYCGN